MEKKYTKCFKCDKVSKLTKCKHCGEYYCSEHSEPKMPLTPNMAFNEKDPVLKQVYEKEWRKGGHACVLYGEWKLNEVKKQKEIDDEILNRALEAVEKVPVKRPLTFDRFRPIKMPSTQHHTEHTIKTLKVPKKMIIIVIIFLVIGLTYFYKPSLFSDVSSELQNFIGSFGINQIPKFNLQNIKPITNMYESNCRNSVESQLEIIRRTSTISINPQIVDLKAFDKTRDGIEYLKSVWPSETYSLDSISKEIQSLCDINAVAIVKTLFTNQENGATINIITPMICDKNGKIGNYSLCLSKNIFNSAIYQMMMPDYYCKDEIPSGWICNSSTISNETNTIQQPSNQCPVESDLKDLITQYAKTKEFTGDDYHFNFWLNTTVQDYKFYCPSWGRNSISINCHRGSKTGENINYYYCNDIYGITIGKNVIDPNGTIKEKIRKTFTSMVIDVHDSVISLSCDNAPYAENCDIIPVGTV